MYSGRVMELSTTNIYLVRHAQSDHRVKEDAIRPLTAQGMVDAQKVTTVLKSMKIDKVLSSPYPRTVDTVKHLADSIGQPVEAIEDFREQHVGGWVDDFKDFSRKQWENFDFKLEGGESLREVQERNIAALLHVREKYKGMNLVIGTHGTALSTMINYYDPTFDFHSFWTIIDRMPYIIHLQFQNEPLVKIEEIELMEEQA